MGGEGARIRTLSDGNGTMAVLATRGSTWRLAATRGYRTVVGLAGKAADPALCRADAEAALARQGEFGLVESAGTRFALGDLGMRDGEGPFAPPPGSTEDAAVAAFSAACGEATVATGAGLATGRDLAAADAVAGADGADAFARDYRWLFPLLRDMRLGGMPDVAAAALSGDPAAAAAALRAVAESPRPPAEWQGPDEGWGDPWSVAPGTVPCAGPGIQLLVRKARGLRAPVPDPRAVLAMAGNVPPDWLPRDAAGLARFGDVAAVAHALAEASGGELSLATLAGPGGRGWEKLAEACSRRGFPADAQGAAKASRIASAMVREFELQVAVPALACLQEASGHDGDPDALAARMDLPGQGPATAASWRALLGGKGLPAVLETLASWEASRTTVRSAVRRATDPRGWPEAFPVKRLGGATLVHLRTPAALLEEGDLMDHCAADYADACASGEAVVVSVRRPGADGIQRPTSTAELSGPALSPGRWRPWLVQHKAHGNRAPSPEDAEAVAALVAELGGGRPAPSAPRRWLGRLVAATRRAPRHGQDGLSEAVGYDWRRPDLVMAAASAWTRFTPRSLRGAGLAELADALGGRSDVLPPPAPPPPRTEGAGRAGTWACLGAAAAALGWAVVADGRAVGGRAEAGTLGDAALAAALAAVARAGPEACPAPWSRCGRAGPFLVRSGGGATEVRIAGSAPAVLLRVVPGEGATWPNGTWWRETLARQARGG